MANTVIVKRSAVPGKVPLVTDLDLGEIAVNTHDGKMFTKKDNGAASIVEMATKDFVQSAIGSNSSAVIVTANRIMTAVDAGRYLFVGGNNLTLTLPNPATLPLGTTFRIVQGSSSSGGAINAPAGSLISQVSGAPNVASLPIEQRTENILTVVSSSAYHVTRISRTPEAPGAAPVYGCRAWVNFNGTGTVAIRGSGNVSSITDNGTGDYRVNFATAMPDANFAVLASYKFDGTLPMPTSQFDQGISAVASGADQCLIYTGFRAGDVHGRIDALQVHVAIFR